MRLSQNSFYWCAWIVALAAMGGSLYFSQIMHLTPCTLCWYQRILMYPLTIFIGIGIFRRNRELPLYVLPFSLIGVGVATYHYLLQLGLVGESAKFCTSMVSCTDRFINYYGFITIPFMSLIAFVFITIAMLFALRAKRERSREG